MLPVQRVQKPLTEPALRVVRDAPVTGVPSRSLRSGALLAASLIIDTHAAGIDCDENCGGDDACDRLDEALALMVAEQELYRVLDV